MGMTACSCLFTTRIGSKGVKLHTKISNGICQSARLCSYPITMTT